MIVSRTPSPPHPASEPALRAAVEALLRASGLDPTDVELRDTPARVARLWQAEFLAGYAMDPAAMSTAAPSSNFRAI